MTRLLFTVIAAAALCSAAVASGGTPNGRIVFAATDAPLNDDVTLVRADGSELDLSNSPALDTAPVVSPNGKLVAFYSTRGGHGAEWVVTIDATKLRRVTPALPGPPNVAWASNGRELAVTGAHARLYRASANGGVWVRIDRGDGVQQLAGWSPGRERVAYVDGLDNVRVVGRGGSALFEVDGEAATWSPTGRLAVQRNSTIWDVYSDVGKHLAAIPAATVAWSADGRLASVTPGGLLQVRAGGTGAPTFSMRDRRGGQPLWAGPAHVLLGGLSYDVAHKAAFEAPAAYRTVPALARSGSAYAESPYGTLVHATLSGSAHAVAKVSFCQGKDADAFSYLQALPDGSGAVFAGDCAAPHDLFSVAPDGTGLARITSTTADEIDPALSPDGTRLAFTRVDGGADCAGCDHVVWTMALDGADAHSVALPSTENSILQDDRPSFSPDGTRLVFARWDAEITGDGSALYTAPANGGTATPLHLAGGYPAWGPSRIAFDAQGKLDTVNPDGSGRRAVTAGDWIPAWSADGRLASIEWGGGFSILLPGTGERLALPGLHAAGFDPPGLAWSPDGTRLAFTAADANGEADVWTVGADGSGLTRVTHALVADGALAWR